MRKPHAIEIGDGVATDSVKMDVVVGVIKAEFQRQPVLANHVAGVIGNLGAMLNPHATISAVPRD
jgi:hypothetical protein